jgi:hypothetical protein
MRHFWFPLVEERYVFPGPVGVNLAGTGQVITATTKRQQYDEAERWTRSNTNMVDNTEGHIMEQQ